MEPHLTLTTMTTRCRRLAAQLRLGGPVTVLSSTIVLLFKYQFFFLHSTLKKPVKTGSKTGTGLTVTGLHWSGHGYAQMGSCCNRLRSRFAPKGPKNRTEPDFEALRAVPSALSTRKRRELRILLKRQNKTHSTFFVPQFPACHPLSRRPHLYTHAHLPA